MKKLFYILISLLLASTVMWVCSEEESVEFLLVSADTIYPAGGGGGSILTGGSLIANAESSEDWCTITVNGNQIDVSVSPNPTLLERTARITLTPESGVPLNVYVIQSGSIFLIDPDGISTLTYEDGVYTGFSPLAGAVFEVELYSDLDYGVSIETPGLTYTLGDGVIYFTVGSSTRPRTLNAEVSVAYANGAVNSKTIRFNQGPTYEELLGEWSMSYYNNSVTSPVQSTIMVTLTENVAGESYILSRIPIWANNDIYGYPVVQYNSSDGSITIPNGQYLDDFEYNGSINYIHLCLLRVSSSTGTTYGYTYWYDTIYHIKFDFDMDYDGMHLVIGDDGSLGGGPPNGFVTYGFRTAPPVAYDPYYWWTQFFFPEFVKL